MLKHDLLYPCAYYIPIQMRELDIICSSYSLKSISLSMCMFYKRAFQTL